MTDYLDETTAIVTAFVSQNTVAATDLPGLIASVHGALARVDQPDAEEASDAVERPTSAQIRKSRSGDKLISFEDGRPYSSLKHHLTSLGMTPDDYRAKWGLPSDYPMVSPAYSEKRSTLAKALGLGRKGNPKAKAKRSKK